MFLFLLACTSTDNLPEVLDGVATATADIDTLVASHVDEVTNAATTDEVAAAEVAYADAWTARHAALADALDMAGQCAMDDDDGVVLDGCMSADTAMDDAVATHTAAGCATLDDCTAAEATHQAEMTGHTDTLRGADADVNDGTMECAMGEMSGM